MNKISVVINTYNAAETLEECILAVKGFDEIVVCDMESTDNTVAIAQKYGCKVVTFPKKKHNIVEPARTFAVQSASHHWVLVVDCDEIVTPELHDYLYSRIMEPDCPAGLYIPRKNSFMGRSMHATYPDFQLRFFIREGTEWPPYIHSIPNINGTVEKLPRSRKELAFVHHDPNSIVARLKKINEYSDHELDKKKNRQFGILSLLWRPSFRFFKTYILKGGIRDGLPGFIWACYESIYQFVIVSKYFEKKQK